ncbi:hypothetical protein O1611_g8414 [Lasiodiplodia mahajangana]|uniref:Uncharacterized protein n=1 Tax=Lasiodiplodia mahajangana TaxID=1108764 RepID=A0ACC2JCN6_9PEZI|nr:hypothetical protein O1611_g8414 [Lasiodiplodia mahajangana]
MAQVPDDMKMANDLQPEPEISHDQSKDPEKRPTPDSSEKASIVECDVEDVTAPEYSEEEYNKLKRKIDRYLLPLMWLCYGIQQTDKTSLGTQATFGLREVHYAGARITKSGLPECQRWLRHHFEPNSVRDWVVAVPARTGLKTWKWKQVRECLVDPCFWFAGINAFLSSVPNGGLTTFNAILNTSFGFRSPPTGYPA